MEFEEPSKRTPRLSARQLDMLLSYMEKNKDLREGKISPRLTKADRKRKWSELAEILNADGRKYSNAVKTPSQWRKCWNDQKAYARSKAARIKTCSQNASTSESLTPVEERLLKIVGITPTTEEPVETLNTSTYNSTPMEVPLIQDAIVIEQEATGKIKEELLSDESNTIETATASEASPQNQSPPRSSLPESSQSAFVAINLNQSNCQFATTQSGFLPLIFKPSETEKPEDKPVSSKELGAVLDNLKQQNDLLQRIAVANEQIAQACMTIANNAEERTKETSAQTELIKDINQTLKYVLKQKSNGEFF